MIKSKIQYIEESKRNGRLIDCYFKVDGKKTGSVNTIKHIMKVAGLSKIELLREFDRWGEVAEV